jgi:hypothetical protein
VRRATGQGCNVSPDERVGCRLSDDPARHERRRVGQAGPRLKGWETTMNNIFWIIGVIVVVIAVLSFFGLR